MRINLLRYEWTLDPNKPKGRTLTAMNCSRRPPAACNKK